MRSNLLLWICVSYLVSMHVESRETLCAQEPRPAAVTDSTPRQQLPNSLRGLPANTAFFYAVHNGGRFLRMLTSSEFSRELTRLGADQAIAEQLPEAMEGSKIELGIFSIEYDETAEQAKQAVSGNEEHLKAVFGQMLQNDAILIGDDTWTSSWESISKLMLIARENLSLEEKNAPDSFELQGIDALLNDEALKQLRIPNTLLSFTLSDAAPAQTLLDQVFESSQSLDSSECGDWRFQRHPIGEDSVLLFSYPLDAWLEDESKKMDLTEKQLAQREQFQNVLRDRAFHFAMGLIQKRLIFFIGEDLRKIPNLLGTSTAPTNRLVTTDALQSVLPDPGEILIASAFASDRYAKSTDALAGAGLLTQTTSVIRGIAGTAKVDDVPVDQLAMGFGIFPGSLEMLGERLDSIGQRWDALAAPKAGWAATISASPSGITGRSVTTTVDPKLPPTPLKIDQHVGKDVIAFYARQGTTTGERILLGYEFLSHVYLGFVEMMLGFAGEEGQVNGDVQRHLQRLRQMPMRLAATVNTHLFPALGVDGQAVVMTRYDATPNSNDDAPIQFSLVSSVASREAMMKSGELLRRWANSFANQVGQIGAALDEQDSTPPFEISMPLVADDGNSDVFTLPFFIDTAPTNSREAIINGEAAEIDVKPNPGILKPAERISWSPESMQAMFHWRLSNRVLAMGTDVTVTREMLEQRQPVSSDRGLKPIEGITRAVTWIDAMQIAKIPEGSGDSAENEEEIKQFQTLVHCFDSYHRITTTHQGKTIRRWKLSMPLGAP